MPHPLEWIKFNDLIVFSIGNDPNVQPAEHTGISTGNVRFITCDIYFINKTQPGNYSMSIRIT